MCHNVNTFDGMLMWNNANKVNKKTVKEIKDQFQKPLVKNYQQQSDNNQSYRNEYEK